MPETRHRLLANAQSIIPLCGARPRHHDGALDFQIIKDIVGRRPAREGGMRLEVEAKDGPHRQRRHVLHAYGAGGRGYEISWGVAGEVVELAKNLPPFSSAPTSSKL